MLPPSFSRQQLVMCMIFSAGYCKFLPRSRPLNLSCSRTSQPPAHQRDSINMYRFLSHSLSGEKKKRKKGKEEDYSLTISQQYTKQWGGEMRYRKRDRLQMHGNLQNTCIVFMFLDSPNMAQNKFSKIRFKRWYGCMKKISVSRSNKFR